jgi:hypothetical protein
LYFNTITIQGFGKRLNFRILSALLAFKVQNITVVKAYLSKSFLNRLGQRTVTQGNTENSTIFKKNNFWGLWHYN